MTTIAAARKGKKICIGADSLSLYGSRKETADHVTSTDKILKLPSMYLGFSGPAVWNEVFSHYFLHYKRFEFGFDSVDAIFAEMLKIHQAFKTEFFLTPQRDPQDLFESSEYLILLINHKGIFELDWKRNIREYSKFAAIGTGEEYALGAMRAVYERESDPEKIVRKGIEAGAAFDKMTGLPATYYSLQLTS